MEGARARHPAGVAHLHLSELHAREEARFAEAHPRSRALAAQARESLFESVPMHLLHLCALNRGILLTPFHNMALMSPATTAADVDRHTEAFGEAVLELSAAVGS